jgi:glycosyltransferase involved in cell wall biosynthesis
LIGDAVLRKEMGARGRRMVEECFAIERICEETLAVYRELL